MSTGKVKCHISTGIILMCLMVSTCSQTTKVGAISEVIDKGVRLRISSDKINYQPGDLVTINVSVENFSNAPVEYTLWNIGDPVVYIHLENTPYSDGQGLFEKDFEGKFVLPAVTQEILKPDEVVSRQVVWEQQLSTYPDSIQAPNGTYSIRSVFYVGTYSSQNKPIELEASITIHIQGAWEIITPEKAIEIARRVPEVSSWYDNHSGPNIVKYEDGQYYLYSLSEWVKVSPHFTSNGMTIEEIKQNYEPDLNVHMVDNTWEVRFFTNYGVSPNDVIVKIEPTTGKVLSFVGE